MSKTLMRVQEADVCTQKHMHMAVHTGCTHLPSARILASPLRKSAHLHAPGMRASPLGVNACTIHAGTWAFHIATRSALFCETVMFFSLVLSLRSGKNGKNV